MVHFAFAAGWRYTIGSLHDERQQADHVTRGRDWDDAPPRSLASRPTPLRPTAASRGGGGCARHCARQVADYKEMSDALKTLMAGDREAVLETVASILHLGNVEFDETKDDASGALETSVRAGASRTALEVRRRVPLPPPIPPQRRTSSCGGEERCRHGVVPRGASCARKACITDTGGSTLGIAPLSRLAREMVRPTDTRTERSSLRPPTLTRRSDGAFVLVVTVVAPALSSPTAPPRRRARETNPTPTNTQQHRRRRGCSGSTAPPRAASTRARAR